MLIFASFSVSTVQAQEPSVSQQVALNAIKRWPEGRLHGEQGHPQWNSDLGILLEGMETAWYGSADRRYFKYLKTSVDGLVTTEGEVAAHDPQRATLDEILLGRQLLFLYRTTLDRRYYKSALWLRQQLLTQSKSNSGVLLQMQDASHGMLLDGLYMVEPFYAEYASVFQEPQDFAEITHQFVLADQQAHDAKTGLMFREWNESKPLPPTGHDAGSSSRMSASGMGYFLMALVDTLPYYPMNDPGRPVLLSLLNRTASALVRYQDRESGQWPEMLDRQGLEGNSFESPANSMLAYVLAKGVRLGYLPRRYSINAEHAWKGIQANAGKADAAGSSKPLASGALLLAASELEPGSDARLGLGKKVVLDAWFNSQKRENAAGKTEYFHYKWSDYSNPGFSLFGHIWDGYGVTKETLYKAPTVEQLKGAQFYIIVSPDNPAKNPDPHYMSAQDATQIAAWVKDGGVLLMLENDPDHADIPHLNLLADKFGLHFNNALTHHVINNDIRMGRIDLSEPKEPFRSAHVIYMKDTCSITLTKGAAPLLTFNGDVLMATAKYGKGSVVAVADPWLYNEYTDGRILPAEYDNFDAGKELVHWLLQQR